MEGHEIWVSKLLLLLKKHSQSPVASMSFHKNFTHLPAYMFALF
jgi:hypothetical protein